MSALPSRVYEPRPQADPKPRRRVTRKPLPRRSDLWPLTRSLLVLLVLAMLVLVELSCYATQTDLSYRLEENNRILYEALTTTRRLEMEIHRHSSLEVIQGRARELGFRPATPEQYILIR
ncbi:MAG: hypothetical protein FWF06_07720 [Symbiobacteriaceae bacterium]|nr:hypothetical protein [Symbiobacteriaceae bacterium]